MTTLTELINMATEMVQSGGFLIGFLLIIVEAFLPVLPLGAFVTLNVNAFGIFPGLLLSWIAAIIGSYLMYLLCYYISTKVIYRFLKKETKEKVVDKMTTFKNIKLTNLVLIITLPFAPSCFINLLAGVSNIKKEKYLISLIIGKAFMISFWAYIGMNLIESLTDIKAIIFILLILLVAYVVSKIISKKLKIE